jgi:DNA-binding transcriptional LysR family regulator
LEDDLGFSLFERTGRALRINARGERLLSGVRDAMRLIDDVVAEISRASLRGPIYVASPADLARVFVLPAIQRLHGLHPGLVPHVRTQIVDSDAGAALLRGDADLVLARGPEPHPDLEIQRLATMSSGIYAGSQHPLARRARVPIDEVSRHPFVAAEGAPRALLDGWPAEIPRKIVARAPSDLLSAFASEGDLLVVLPDALASQSGLVRLPVDMISPIPVFAVRRRPLQSGGKTDAFLSALAPALVRAEGA